MESGRDSYLQFFRYYHTLKNMKLSQILSYIAFKHRRKKLSIIDNRGVIAFAEGLKQNYKFEENQKSFEFCFFNQPVSFNLDEMCWEPVTLSSEVEKIWLEKLHSFDWLNESSNVALKQASFLVLDWLSKFGDEHSKAWEPFTLSKRINSWVKWLSNNEVQPEIISLMKLSISLQLKRLFVDMEYHKPANHLMENFRGFFAGCKYLITSRQYFNNELEYQLEQTIDDCLKQLNIQILADGAHFERSPMYHAIMLETIKDIQAIMLIVNKQGFLLPEIIDKAKELAILCDEKTKLMTEWLKKMTMPDGEIVQFNDSARIKGLKPDYEDLTELLESSGYFIKHNKNYSFILSCSSPMPAFLPEHSHCDILSYELAINGERIIIDSGCSGYDNETLRQMSRETEAHNLPMVQHMEQSDIWGQFNFGKRAIVTKRIYNSDASNLEIAIKDQFGQKLERKIAFSNNTIEISDFLRKRRMQGCFISLIHLAPNIELEISQEENNANIVNCKMTNDLKFSIITNANIRVSDYISFPDFGKSVGAKMLILSNKEAEELSYVIKW